MELETKLDLILRKLTDIEKRLSVVESVIKPKNQQEEQDINISQMDLIILFNFIKKFGFDKYTVINNITYVDLKDIAEFLRKNSSKIKLFYEYRSLGGKMSFNTIVEEKVNLEALVQTMKDI
jgi:hypothetical protein